ncbi:uncharacterized protein isoform X2 [Salmo salar]|uniref:Uncharacterized protein isoform X2 n=1 Tax=Salmo salar TaxID=8030 RepID=A0ABM3D7G3_SALSA|nr:uncharacterized protein LOC106575220 isoform X2 [Salmo salar]
METSTTAVTTIPSTWIGALNDPVTELFTQSSVAGVLTTPAHMTETISDAFVGVLTTPAHMTETISDAFVGVLTTPAHMTETISDAFVGVLTTPAHMTETISDAFVGVLTTPAHMTETISDAFVGVLTITSADMTETTSDTLLVGATNTYEGSFEAIFIEVIFPLLGVLVLVGALVLCYIAKRKGNYHTYEAECGDSVDTYGSASQIEQVQLEILNEEE